MDKVRVAGKKKLAAVLIPSAGVAFAEAASPEAAAAAFADKLESALADKFPSPRGYRERLLVLAANIPNIASDIAKLSPRTLVAADSSTLLSEHQRRAAERDAKRRAKLQTLPAEESVQDLLCPVCHYPIRARLNTNMFALDDDVLGNQYDNNYDNLCQCDPPEDVIERFGKTPPSSSSSSTERDEEQQAAPPQPRPSPS